MSMERNVNSSNIHELTLPYIPSHLFAELLPYLNSNGRLFEIKDIEIHFQSETTTYASKTETNLPFSIRKVGDDYFAILRGRDDFVLGQGNFGKIKLAQNLRTNELVALKSQRQQKRIKGIEVRIEPANYLENRSKDEYANLTIAQQAIGNIGFVDKKDGELAYQFLMKLIPGVNLATFNEDRHSLPAYSRIDAAIQIIQFVSFLLKNNILHRDIKGENIIINPEGHAKPIDFGLAIITDKTKEAKDSWLGTPEFIAPEIYQQSANNGNCSYNEKTEIYALGITLLHWFGYDIDRGSYDRAHHQYKDTKQQCDPHIYPAMNFDSLQQPYPQQYIPEKIIREKVFDLIKSMIVEDPQKRPTLHKAQETLGFIRDSFNLDLSRMMTVCFVNHAELRANMSNQSFLNKLKQFDRVVLLDNENDNNTKYYLELKHEMEKKGITLDETIYRNNDIQHLIERLPEHMDKNNKRSVNSYFVLSDTIQPPANSKICAIHLSERHIRDHIKSHLEKSKLSNTDLHKIIRIIIGEITRLERKYQLAESTNTPIPSAILKRQPIIRNRVQQLRNLKKSFEQDHKNGKLFYSTLLETMLKPSTDLSLGLFSKSTKTAQKLKVITQEINSSIDSATKKRR